MNDFAHTDEGLPSCEDPFHTNEVLPSYEDPFETNTTSHFLHDDLDQMLLHVDFPQLIELAVRVKKARQVLLDAPPHPRTTRSALSSQEVQQAVMRMQQQLLRRPILPGVTVERGMNPIIDCTIDDALSTLNSEWDHLAKWTEQGLTGKETQSNAKKRGRAKKEAIAIKYSKWQTDILMKWMIDNREQPFPDQDAILDLAKQTALEKSQVINWTTNVRKRNRKATCNGEKKPHHFIDFLFLVQDREERERNGGDDDDSTSATIQRSASFPRSKPAPKVGIRKTRSFTAAATTKAAQSIVRPAQTPSSQGCPPKSKEKQSQSIFRRTSTAQSSRTKKVKTKRSKGRSLSKSAGDSDIVLADIEPLPFKPGPSEDPNLWLEFERWWALKNDTPGSTASIVPAVTLDSLDVNAPRFPTPQELDNIEFDTNAEFAAWSEDLGYPHLEL